MSLHPGAHPGHPGGHPGETDHPHLARKGVVRTALVPARYGDSSGVRGAAWLFPLLP